MDLQPETQRRFLAILKQETEQTAALLELLEREYELLKSSPGKDLEALLAQKQQQLQRVEQSTLAHHRFLQQQGLPCDRRGTESYLEQSRENLALSSAWKGHLELLQACRRQNEINGGTVALNQRHVNQALELLLGQGDGNKTYGPSGESHPTRPSNTLGKA